MNIFKSWRDVSPDAIAVCLMQFIIMNKQQNTYKGI